LDFVYSCKQRHFICFCNGYIVYFLSSFKEICKKKINRNRSSDVENQSLNVNHDENLDIYKEFIEFQKIVSSILNINNA
jgi:hypothetical protein